MNRVSENRISQIKNMGIQREKKVQNKPIKVRSHIIFKGDPAFHYDSVEYVPVTRRKKIFEDQQDNILPPDLLFSEQALKQHNQKFQDQNLLHQNIIATFDRQIRTYDEDTHGNRNINSKRRLTSQMEEVYFEPNNLETDLHFGLAPQNQDDPNLLIHSSKASQTTQKKGQNTLINTLPNGIPSNFTNSAGPAVSFSYQGKKLLKQEDQIIQSRVKKVTNLKLTTKTVFVNQGGVMAPKKNKKIQMQESGYYDFEGNHQQMHQKNESLIHQLKMGQNSHFNFKGGNSSQFINNLINQQHLSLQSQRNFERYKKQISEGNKFLINDRNTPTKSNVNGNRSSIVSYKSIQKQFENDSAIKNQPSVSKIQNQLFYQNKANQSGKMQLMNETRPQDSLIVKIFEQNLQKKQLKSVLSNSQDFHENEASLFDRILNERESIFSKNKTPQTPVFRKTADKQISSIKIMKNDKASSDENLIHKPEDFITDSQCIPAGLKRSININNFKDKAYEEVKSEHIKGGNEQNYILESKVKRIEENGQASQKKNRKTQLRDAQINTSNQKKQLKNRRSKTQIQISNESIPESIENQDEQESDEVIDQWNDEDYFNEEESSEEEEYQKEKKKRKFSKNQRLNFKNPKKKYENENQLQDFLKEQQEKIQLRQINKIMLNLPQAKKHFQKNKKNKYMRALQQKEQDTQNFTTQTISQQPVVYADANALTPQQKQLLLAAGINLVGNSFLQNTQQVTNQVPNQFQNSMPNQSINLIKQQQNLPTFFNYNNQGSQNPNVQDISKNFPFDQPQTRQDGSSEDNYKQSEKKFQEINKVLYNNLKNFLSKIQPMNQASHRNNEYRYKFIQSPGQNEVGSPISFKDPDQIRRNFMQPHVSVKQSSKKQTFDTGKRSNQQGKRDLYSRQIYDDLRRFNSSSNKKYPSKEKYSNVREDSPNDQSRYYSFYNDDIVEGKCVGFTQNLYGEEDYSQVKEKKEKRRLNQNPSQKSLKGKYQIRENSEISLLNKKIEQLYKQIHEELPMIRRQIEENQQQIRKIETTLLIKNTAEQHNLIKILQKMKLKDTELQLLQVQTRHKDQQLSLYQNQISTLKAEFMGNNNQLLKEVEEENYFEQRLNKIRNYNEKLCTKINHSKINPSKLNPSFIVQAQSAKIPHMQIITSHKRQFMEPYERQSKHIPDMQFRHVAERQFKLI